MGRYVALLRAINLAGRNKVRMADLRELFEALGFHDVRTLLQSGNVVFTGTSRSTARLEAMLEAEAAGRLGLTVDFFVRKATAWEDVRQANPFPMEAERDPAKLLVMLLKAKPDREAVRALEQRPSAGERVLVTPQGVYIFYPDGLGRSRLTSSVVERTLGTGGTGRNWNTVVRIADLLSHR